MLRSLKSALAVTALASGLAFCVTTVASADETTTTTTEHHDDGPGAVITAPARAAGAVVDTIVGGHPEGCTHKKVTKTDGDTGDTVSKSRTDCD